MCSFASISVAIVALLYPVFAAPTSATVNGQTYSIDSSIIKDVVIIGGGSGGTYSAISIRDSGKSIVVVEATDRLGGHTQTYIEPTTGFPIEYGVEFFHNQTQVLDYFTRLNVSYAQLSIGSAPPTT
jgi:phytoene dehydrogenase-like protein